MSITLDILMTTSRLKPFQDTVLLIRVLSLSTKYQLPSHVRLFLTPWTVACQAPLSTEFSRQEYWSGLTFLSSGDLPDPGFKPRSLQADSLLGGMH